MKFAEAAKRHLARYKSERLGVADPGLWQGREYDHILPSQRYELNILEPFRAEFWSAFESMGVKLHHGFCNLNSSQAMCFNLFFTILDSAELLGTALGIDLGGTVDAEFEKVLDRAEGTNFDLYLASSQGASVGVEVKYTESGFGTAKGDEAHEGKRTGIYAPNLSGKVSPIYLEGTLFYTNYQLLRNISFLGRPDGLTNLVILFPQASDSLVHTEQLLDAILLPGFRQLVSIRHMEDVANEVRGCATTPAMAHHYEMFLEKYVPAP